MESRIVIVYHEYLGLTRMLENYGILLVDDESVYHAIVSALLRPEFGEIDCVDDADAAGHAVIKRRYDLILMDIRLDGQDGRDLVTRVRAASEWNRLCPIIAFTADRPSDGEQYFVDRGFDGWLAKPFLAETLLQTVRRWLTGQAGPAPEPGSKLASLLGTEAAEAMIGRFYDNLSEAVEQVDGGADVAPIGHKLGGLAGTLGFGGLSAAWLSLQDSAEAWPTVRSLTMEALARRRTRPVK